MKAKLISTTDKHPNLSFNIEEGDLWNIGNDPTQSQFLLDDPNIESIHAIIKKAEDGFTIENGSNEHPISINGALITQPQKLFEGDKVQIGDGEFRYEESPETLISELAPPEEPIETPTPPPEENKSETPNEEEDEPTIFPEESPEVAEVHFGIEEEGRWLLKIVGGPNNGAEFFMKSNHDYLLGTDPHVCDIILHDTSVSRQHAKIHISDTDQLTIEDLNSRNGVFIKGTRVDKQHPLPPSTLVTLGTSSFIVYDREGDMQTIISPLLPSIVKTLQQEQKEGQPPKEAGEVAAASTALHVEEEPQGWRWESIVLLSALLALFGLIGYGTYSLFQSAPLQPITSEQVDQSVGRYLKVYPAVNYSYLPSRNTLILTGHLENQAAKVDLINDLQQIKEIKTVDDSGLVIDEGVWREINSILSRTPEWRGITIQSPAAGKFVAVGVLRSRREAEALDSYLRVNFPYYDLLENKVVVEEDVVNQVYNLLSKANMRGIIAKFNNGELIFGGTAAYEQQDKLKEIMEQSRMIPGVRTVKNTVIVTAPEQVGVIDLTSRYEVTGRSQLGGNKYSVVIEGKILQEKDILDGMTITKITADAIYLKKGDSQFRINYK